MDEANRMRTAMVNELISARTKMKEFPHESSKFKCAQSRQQLLEKILYNFQPYPEIDIRVCVGCGHVEGDLMGPTALACCPDNKPVALRDFIRVRFLPEPMREWLKDKIDGCDNLGGMEKEKWAFQQCLKELRSK